MRKPGSEERASERDDDPMLEEQRPHLIHDRRAVDDEPSAHPVDGLQLELLARLQRHAPHACG